MFLIEVFILGLIAMSTTFGLSTLFGAFTWDNLAVGILTAILAESVFQIVGRFYVLIHQPVYQDAPAQASYPDTATTCDDIPADPDMRTIRKATYAPQLTPSSPAQATLFGTWEPVTIENVQRPAGVPSHFVFRDGFWQSP